MRVAIFSDNFYPELSGVADSALTLGKELAKRGHDICFFVPAFTAKEYQKSKLPIGEPDLDPHIKIVRFWSLPLLNSPNSQDRLVLFTGWRWWQVKKFRPDIIHINTASLLGLDGLLAGKILRVPVIGTSHTPVLEFIKYVPGQSKILATIFSYFTSWFYNHCQYVTGPSKYILADMQKYGFHNRSKTMSNLIDVSNFKPVASEQKKELKNKFGLPDFNLLYVGRLAEEKHIDVLIKAIYLLKKEIPDIKLALTGHGSAEKNLHDLVQELNLINEVIFCGTIPFSDLIELYQASDVFAVASTAETQCIGLMQAMAVGLPVIGVRYGGLVEYITDETGFLIDVGDYKTLADLVSFLYHNKHEIEKLGNGGLAWAKNFSIDQIAGDWEDLFKKVIDNYKK